MSNWADPHLNVQTDALRGTVSGESAMARHRSGGPVQWSSSPISRREPMKIVVDYDECASNAVCMGIAPEVFEVRDDGFLYVLNENPGEELRDNVRQAANGCPTGAITIVEDE
jgi:ferredoxin